MVGLNHIEQVAKAKGLPVIGVSDWGRRDFFFGEAKETAGLRKLKVVEA